MMKYFAGLIFVLVFSANLYGQDKNEKTEAVTIPPGPAFTFEEETHDFGDINQGEKVKHTFAFENTGDAPLIITDVRVTCGCTATDWPREPIGPGEKSSITVEFNSAGKKGRQNKVITIISNAVTPLNRVTIATNVVVKNKDTE